MAVPIYTTDLQTINLCTGIWNELTDAKVGSAPTENDTDNFIAGIDSTTEAVRASGLSSMYAPIIPITIPNGEAVFMWLYFASMPVMATLALGGYRVAIGKDTNNYKMWSVLGSDTLPKGGWVSVAVDPLITPHFTVGTPDGTTEAFGSVILLNTGVAKGNAFANDFQRYGRSIISEHGEVGNYATFDGTAIQNDLINNKWGLFEKVGSSYSQKGRYQMGTVTNPVDFRDADKTINIENSLNVQSDFNVFEVVNALSYIEWVGITINSLCPVSRGDFLMTDNATVIHSGCTFNDKGTFTYQSNAVINNGTVFRRCSPVTQGSAPITDCKFDSAFGVTALYADDLGIVSNNDFKSTGVGYGVDIGNITTTQSIDWKNTESSYVTGTSGTDVGVTPTGNETILCNVSVGEVLTINIQTGASIPSVANSGTGTVNVVAGQVTLTLTGLPIGIEVRIRQGSFTIEHWQDVTTGFVSYPYTYTSDKNVTISFSGAGITESFTLPFVLGSQDQTSLITFNNDPSFQS